MKCNIRQKELWFYGWENVIETNRGKKHRGMVSLNYLSPILCECYTISDCIIH